MKAARDASGLTQQQVMRAIGVKWQSKISRWESDKLLPTFDELAAFAHAVGCTDRDALAFGPERRRRPRGDAPGSAA